MHDIQVISDHRHQLAEAPVWDADLQTLYWADLLGQKIYAYGLADGAIKSYPLDETIGCIGLAQPGHLIVALRSGLYRFCLEAETLQHVVTPEGEPFADTRLNDGKVTPHGDFLVGTMDETFQDNIGKLYHISREGKARLIKEGFMVSNGLAWSRDGQWMYHSCSRRQKIWRYRYSKNPPFISDEQLFAAPTEQIGRPDGGACDVAGGYWSAGVSAGMLNHFDQDGNLVEQIALPMKAPTMPCFGGTDMRTLYVTSLSHQHQAADFAAYPLSGGVIGLRVDVAGVPVGRFGVNTQ